MKVKKTRNLIRCGNFELMFGWEKDFAFCLQIKSGFLWQVKGRRRLGVMFELTSSGGRRWKASPYAKRSECPDLWEAADAMGASAARPGPLGQGAPGYKD